MGNISQRADKAVRRILRCRVNVKVFWAFVCLFCAALAATAFFSMLAMIGFNNSVINYELSTETEAVYEYSVKGTKYSYEVSHIIPLAIMSSTENVYYMKEKPEMRVGILDVALYPVLLAVFGAGFSVLINRAQLDFGENPETLRSYKVQAIISLASVIPCCTCMFFASTFNIRVYIDKAELVRSIRASYILFIIAGANALMWAITLLVRSRKIAKST